MKGVSVKISLIDGKEEITLMDAEAVYLLWRSAQRGYARCWIKIGSGGYLDVSLIHERTFEDVIIDTFRDTDPG